MSRFEITQGLLELLRQRQFNPPLVEALQDLLGVGFEEEPKFLEAVFALDPPASDREAAALLRSADRHFQEAVVLFENAHRHHVKGRLSEAIRLYRRSLKAFPTAEAHTFLGWAFSFQNRYNEAIAECHAAIELDPEFGNPYNDIGSYLINLGKPDEAIPWLQQAIEAPRYEPRHFPWVNLGRAYEELRQPDKALDAYLRAHELAPEYEFPLQRIDRLCGPAERLN